MDWNILEFREEGKFESSGLVREARMTPEISVYSIDWLLIIQKFFVFSFSSLLFDIVITNFNLKHDKQKYLSIMD